MKDIRTPDQRKMVERIRSKISYMDPPRLYESCVLLLSIIDSLQPKQYAEEELRAAFEDNENRDPVFADEIIRDAEGSYKDHVVEVAWLNFKRCARFLKALKEDK